MFRSVLSVLTGILTWGVLCVSANAVLMAALPGAFHADGSTDSVPILVFFLFYLTSLSVLAGYLTATLAPRQKQLHVLVLALIQLAIGIVVQAISWNATPLWYHIPFLALVVPAHLYGGALAWSRKFEAAHT